MTKSLKQELEKYAESNTSRFHMPGHNGENISPLYASAKYDVTELDFNDNLNCPNDVILDLENRIAEFCKVDKSLISTSGTTTSILIGLGALRQCGKVIAVDQFSHKSVFEAARHWGYKIKIIPREFTKEGIPVPLSEEALQSFLDSNQDIRIVSLTYPDYFGGCIEFWRYANIVKAKGYKLFVDSAHGSHFRMRMAMTGTEFADVVAESWHKTLPVYTGGSILHINDKSREIIDKALLIRSKIHSSSPSYLIMASIEEALELQKEWLEKHVYEEIFKIKLDFMSKHSNFDFIGNTFDVAKITVNADYNEFVKNGIQPETHWGRWTNFIITPLNLNKFDQVDNLLYKLKPIKKINLVRIPKTPSILPKPIPVDSIIKYVDLDESIGKISATDVGAYPPGVPILFEGQIIKKSHVDFLKKNIGHTFNLNQGKIAILDSRS